MANTQQEMFGGSWTQEKLTCLKKYLQAYSTIFNKNRRAQYFRTTYVDAFAGTGYMRQPEFSSGQLLPELCEPAEDYAKGSAVRALEVEPAFRSYLFIEANEDRFIELQQLKTKFPAKAASIQVVRANANEYLLEWCKDIDWEMNRAVVFLDPFGMEVEWRLVEAIAKTKAIDLWLLFPLFATNRLLVRHGRPPDAWCRRLTLTLGTSEWEEQFYRTEAASLIPGLELTYKVADQAKIADYFLSRLRSAFAGVADPLVLRNTRGQPLYLFCFAAANGRGAPTALKIAQSIIGS